MSFDAFIGDFIVSFVFDVMLIVIITGFLWIIRLPK